MIYATELIVQQRKLFHKLEPSTLCEGKFRTAKRAVKASWSYFNQCSAKGMTFQGEQTAKDLTFKEVHCFSINIAEHVSSTLWFEL